MDSKSDEFDPSQDRNHKQKVVKLCGCDEYEVEIDCVIADLVVLINSYFDYPVTYMSCQHNVNGYASIVFGIDQFKKLTDLVSEKINEKYSEEEIELESRVLVPLLNRFIIGDFTDKRKNKFEITCDWFSGNEKISLNAHWQFVQSEIPKIIQEIRDILD